MRTAVAGRTTVMMYHEVLPDGVGIPYWSLVRESAFRRQMAHLCEHYEVVSVDAAMDRMQSSEPFSPSSRPLAVITFDDGYAGNFSCALPILRELQLPFTVYIATAAVESGQRHWYDEVTRGLVALGRRSIDIATSRGRLAYSGRHLSDYRRWEAISRIHSALKELPADERQEISSSLAPTAAVADLRMMTPDELRQLSNEKSACIGCHTHGHDLLDQISPDQARETILRAQALLTDWTGRTPRHFSYPNGNFTPALAQLVGHLGFASAVTTQERQWRPRDSRYTIPRIGIGRFDNLNLFRAKISGALSGSAE